MCSPKRLHPSETKKRIRLSLGLVVSLLIHLCMAAALVFYSFSDPKKQGAKSGPKGSFEALFLGNQKTSLPQKNEFSRLNVQEQKESHLSKNLDFYSNTSLLPLDFSFDDPPALALKDLNSKRQTAPSTKQPTKGTNRQHLKTQSQNDQQISAHERPQSNGAEPNASPLGPPAEKGNLSRSGNEQGAQTRVGQSFISDKEEKKHFGKILTKIRQNSAKRYARLVADGKELEGIVKIRIRIAQSGKIAALSVTKSSGFKMLDEIAVAASRDEEPFPYYPNTLEIPVYFKRGE